MKKTLKIAILFHFMFADFALFAQIGGPGDDDNNGGTGLEGGDPPAAAINSKLWMLLLLALLYSYFKFKKSIRKE